MPTTLKEEVKAAHWGIEPVPAQHRRLSGIDLAVLWADLGIGLLVIVAGALLVAPADQFGFGLSLGAAMVAILIGSIIGSFLLGLGGVIGTREGKPTMVLLRNVLGKTGSWIPTGLNVAQLLGWTAIELWAMGRVGNVLGERLFGFSSFIFWLVVFSILVLVLSLWGPVGVVRTWMEKFGAWVLIGVGALVTLYLLTEVDVAALVARGGAGGALIFGLPMDIVIALPVSWVPLVADYNRFSSSRRGSFWGTFLGYTFANVWFYALGVLLLLGVEEVSPSPESLAVGILTLGGLTVTGWLLLAGMLVGESDEAFADVYSAAVSIRNIFPRMDNRMLVIAVTLAGALLAGRFSMLTYELFLFLLGSVFVPLLGVWFADYFLLGNRSEETSGIRWTSVVPWIVGFIVYHWIAPTPLGWWREFTTSILGTPLAESLPWMGASIPSFLCAFLLHAGLGSVRKRA